MSRTVAVIPARGGSKGIPRKNMRLMCGRPLICYAIENALASALINDVIVSSDSEEVLSFVAQYDGVIAMNRDPGLAGDIVTLDPVIHDAVRRQETACGKAYDIVVTMQPTSPLLRVETLDSALGIFEGSEFDTMLSVVNAPHLSWREDANGTVVPNYKNRLNRQELPPEYRETGAFVLTRRRCMSALSRFGDRVGVFEIPDLESIDIDTRQDWIVCESLLSSKKIVFRVDGYRELGMGHIYRALTLAYELIEHDIRFICRSDHREGIRKLRSANMPVVEIADDEELFRWLEANRPDIFVCDCLDTDAAYVRMVKRFVSRFVTVEDLGDGTGQADAVVNALYEGASPHANTYVGKKYVCLRDEFLEAKPSAFREEVTRVLVIFGGTDPLDMSVRIYNLAKDVNRDGVKYVFDFVLGPGFRNPTVVAAPESGIEVSQDIARVSDHMRKADVALSSQGRTTFELASMGVPTIVLAQNEREQLHVFAQMNNGFINLGLGSNVSDEDILGTLEWLADAKSVRREMRQLMLSNDLKSGIRRVKRIILGEGL